MPLTIAKTYRHNTEGTYIYDVLNNNFGSRTYNINFRGESVQRGLTNGLIKYIGDKLTTTISSNQSRACMFCIYSPQNTTGVMFQLGFKLSNANGFNFISNGGCVQEAYNDSTGAYASCLSATLSSITMSATARYPFTEYRDISVDIPCLPIFGSEARALDYVNGIDTSLDDALNVWEPETEPDGTEYTIYNTGQRGTWELGDIVTDVSTPFYRWVRVKLANTDTIDGRLAFYRVGLEDSIIKLKPVLTASVVYCEYSTDGGANWQTSDTFPYQYIYGERINELGTFTYATRTGLNGDTGVPIFEDEATATAWVNHSPDVDITDAVNYEDIASRYKLSNKTGTAEDDTIMGTASGFRSHFTQKYLLDRGDVSVIANALFDTTTTIFEDIKKGLEMFGERIIDSICSLTYYPIDLTTIFTQLQSQTYIFFGGYQFQPENFSVNKLVGYSGYIDLGSFTIEPTFPNIENAQNYSPFCRVSIYLPYCGMFELDYNKYVNKTIRVRYYIDVNTGGCLVCLFDSATGGRLLDYMNGQIGSQIPITITDYSGYASAELRNISNLAGVGGNVLTTGIAGASGDIMGAGVGAVSSVTGFGKAMYDLSTTSINQFNSTKGSSGALGNQYLPQYVYLVFEYVRTEETANLLQLEGKPSNKSGTVGSFSGYLEVDSVQLQCSGATETEKAEIISILHNGIII